MSDVIDRQQVWAENHALVADLQRYEGDRASYALPCRLSWIFDETVIYGAANDTQPAL